MSPLQYSENTQQIFNGEIQELILHNLIVSAACVSVLLLPTKHLLDAECHIDRPWWWWWCCVSTVIWFNCLWRELISVFSSHSVVWIQFNSGFDLYHWKLLGHTKYVFNEVAEITSSTYRWCIFLTPAMCKTLLHIRSVFIEVERY